MEKSKLYTNNMISIFEWLTPKEQVDMQKLSNEFYIHVIPMAMWRLKTRPYIGDRIVYYFEERSRNVHSYDIIKRVQTQCQIERDIPYFFNTIAVDK